MPSRLTATFDRLRNDGRKGLVTYTTAGDPDVQFVYLKGSKSVIAERVAMRHDHFMPAGLLESQFTALEEPGPDEHAWVADVCNSLDSVVANLIDRAH